MLLAERGPGGPLVEREQDLAILEAALTDGVRGRSAVVVIEGPAGIGKTRLLAEGRRLAHEAGARVLVARASQLEGELAFGVVRQLFEATLRADGQDAVISAAASAGELLNAPPRAAAGGGEKDTSFAMLHSLYWLTVTLATDAPLVIAVDDLHWCDEPSLRFLNYLVRRLEGLSVTVLCTVRPREQRARAPLVTEIVADPLATSIQPGPLSYEATARLVSEGLGADANGAFSTACLTATGGNPLLLRELISTMQVEGVAPDSDHVSAVAELGPRAVSRAVLVRLGRLTDDALRLARAASVMSVGADLPLLAELAGLVLEDAAAAANALITADVLSTDAGAGFVHPLIGAAIYEDIPTHDRALAHERAAHHLRARGAFADTVAVHLALAPARGRKWVCDVLEEAARKSLRAGSPASAARYLARALAEPPPSERRARLLLELGAAEAMFDLSSAAEHLTEASMQSSDSAVRNEAAVTLARTLLFGGRADEAAALIRRAATEMERGSEPASGARGAGVDGPGVRHRPAPCAGAARASPGARRGCRREDGRRGRFATVGLRRPARGGLRAACTRRAGGRRSDRRRQRVSLHHGDPHPGRADRQEADGAWEEFLQQARANGSLAAKAGSSLWRGYSSLRRGELDDAQESLESALEEFRLVGSASLPREHHAAFLSAILRERGDLHGARRVIEAVEAPRDASDAARYWLDGLAELLLAEERFAEALLVAEDMERRFAFLANPIDTPARSHRAVALYHLGRHDEGLAVAGESLELARRWGAPAALARALRVLGTLQRDDGLGHLRAAVDAAETSVARLEHAKALVALGTSLRRARRQTDAREPLRRGLEIADALGAGALVARARHELRAAGARPRGTASGGPAALTPAEHRVSERAAAGQTNRAIAEALFVTTKTVELHLRNAYRKLGVSSRRDLAGKLHRDPVDA